MFRLQRGISNDRFSAVCHVGSARRIRRPGSFSQINKFITLSLVISGTIIQRISTIIIMTRKKEKKKYTITSGRAMPLPKHLTSQCCPQQLSDKQSITRGFWPPRYSDTYACSYYLWGHHEIWIHILIVRTVR